MFDVVGLCLQLEDVARSFDVPGADASDLTCLDIFMDTRSQTSVDTAIPGGEVVEMSLDGVHLCQCVLLARAFA